MEAEAVDPWIPPMLVGRRGYQKDVNYWLGQVLATLWLCQNSELENHYV